MSRSTQRERGKAGVTFLLVCAALILLAAVYGRPLRRWVRESLMQRVTSAHYQIFCPPGAMPADTMRKFAADREPVFNALDAHLGDAGSNAEIRVIFDPRYSGEASPNSSQNYDVTGATIRTKLTGPTPELDPAADTEALLHIAWGKPGNAQIAHWSSVWLARASRGQDLGMAAAEVEQRLGHEKVASLFAQRPGGNASTKDWDLLGAAWISQVSEFGGMSTVRKLYSTKMQHGNEAELASALGTTPLELERKWQLWIYAYLAGMPSPSQSMPMSMPMNMPMPGR